jgi:hypothetical protein
MADEIEIALAKAKAKAKAIQIRMRLRKKVKSMSSEKVVEKPIVLPKKTKSKPEVSKLEITREDAISRLRSYVVKHYGSEFKVEPDDYKNHITISPVSWQLGEDIMEKIVPNVVGYKHYNQTIYDRVAGKEGKHILTISEAQIVYKSQIQHKGNSRFSDHKKYMYSFVVDSLDSVYWFGRYYPTTNISESSIEDRAKRKKKTLDKFDLDKSNFQSLNGWSEGEYHVGNWVLTNSGNLGRIVSYTEKAHVYCFDGILRKFDDVSLHKIDPNFGKAIAIVNSLHSEGYDKEKYLKEVFEIEDGCKILMNVLLLLGLNEVIDLNVISGINYQNTSRLGVEDIMEEACRRMLEDPQTFFVKDILNAIEDRTVFWYNYIMMASYDGRVGVHHLVSPEEMYQNLEISFAVNESLSRKILGVNPLDGQRARAIVKAAITDIFYTKFNYIGGKEIVKLKGENKERYEVAILSIFNAILYGVFDKDKTYELTSSHPLSVDLEVDGRIVSHDKFSNWINDLKINNQSKFFKYYSYSYSCMKSREAIQKMAKWSKIVEKNAHAIDYIDAVKKIGIDTCYSVKTPIENVGKNLSIGDWVVIQSQYLTINKDNEISARYGLKFGVIVGYHKGVKEYRVLDMEMKSTLMSRKLLKSIDEREAELLMLKEYIDLYGEQAEKAIKSLWVWNERKTRDRIYEIAKANGEDPAAKYGNVDYRLTKSFWNVPKPKVKIVEDPNYQYDLKTSFHEYLFV